MCFVCSGGGGGGAHTLTPCVFVLVVWVEHSGEICVERNALHLLHLARSDLQTSNSLKLLIST